MALLKRRKTPVEFRTADTAMVPELPADSSTARNSGRTEIRKSEISYGYPITKKHFNITFNNES